MRPPVFKMVHAWTLQLMGSGGRFERTYFDVCVFNPLAPSHCQYNLSTCYTKQENLKKRAYEQRVIGRLIEHSSFTSLVLSASGTLALQTKLIFFYKRLAFKINETSHIPRHCPDFVPD